MDRTAAQSCRRRCASLNHARVLPHRRPAPRPGSARSPTARRYPRVHGDHRPRGRCRRQAVTDDRRRKARRRRLGDRRRGRRAGRSQSAGDALPARCAGAQSRRCNGETTALGLAGSCAEDGPASADRFNCRLDATSPAGAYGGSLDPAGRSRPQEAGGVAVRIADGADADHRRAPGGTPSVADRG